MLMKQLIDLTSTRSKFWIGIHRTLSILSVFNCPTILAIQPGTSSQEHGSICLWQLANVGQDDRNEIDNIKATLIERLHLSSFIHCGKITVVTPLSTLPS